MTILFVCKMNVGRSQIAEELFNTYVNGHIGISAGTHAKINEEKKLKEFAMYVVDVLKEKNIDASNKIPIQLTPELVNFADKVVFITGREDAPDYILNSNKVTYWEVEDGTEQDYDFHIHMRDQIEVMVKELISEIG